MYQGNGDAWGSPPPKGGFITGQRALCTTIRGGQSGCGGSWCSARGKLSAGQPCASASRVEVGTEPRSPGTPRQGPVSLAFLFSAREPPTIASRVSSLGTGRRQGREPNSAMRMHLMAPGGTVTLAAGRVPRIGRAAPGRVGARGPILCPVKLLPFFCSYC